MIEDAQPGPAGASGAPLRRFPRPLPLWLSIIGNVLAALVIVSLVQAFLVRVHNVSSGSMETTLHVNDRVLSSNVPYWSSGPQRGDIVIFGHGEDWDSPTRTPASNPLLAAGRLFGDITGIGTSNRIYTVKRVIGLPGDVVACCDPLGRVTVNGKPIDEPYLYEDLVFTRGSLDCRTQSTSPRCFKPLRVPEGRYLVMGDHRSNSADSVAYCRSRAAGTDCGRFVPAERISGKVVAKAWPPGPIP